MTCRIGAAALTTIGLIACCLTPQLALAQAWTRDAGHGYTSLSYRHISADRFYDADGNEFSSADYAQHVLGFYGEVGVIDRWLTLVLDGEVLRRNVLADQGATFGMGDFRVSAWTGALTAPFRLSFGVSLGIPTGDQTPDADEGEDEIAQITARSLPTGDGEVDVTFQTAAGHGFRWNDLSLDLFVQGVLGYALRTEGFTDQFVYRAEVGFRPTAEGWNRGLLVLRVSGIELLGETNETLGAVGLGDGISYTAYGPELIVDVWDRLFLSAGFESALRATNLPAAISTKFAVAYEF